VSFLPCVGRGGTVMQLTPGCPRAWSLTAWLKPVWHPIVTRLQTSLVDPSALLVSLCWEKRGLAAGRSPGALPPRASYSTSWCGAENGVPGASRGWDLLPTRSLSSCGIPEWALPIPTCGLFRRTGLSEDGLVQRVLSHHTSVKNPLSVRHCT